MPRVFKLVADAKQFNGVNVDLPEGARDAMLLGQPSTCSTPVGIPFRDRWRRNQPIGDLVEYDQALPIVSERAKNILAQMLHTSVFYPVSILGTTAYFWSVQEFSDILDTEKSIIVRYPSGRPMGIEKFVFSSAPPQTPIFKLAALGHNSSVYLSELGLEALRRSTLRGFDGCSEVWPAPGGRD